MNIAYLAFQHDTSPLNTFKAWNDIRVGDVDKQLVDSSGTLTGWLLTHTGDATGFNNGAETVGTGDASWADESGIMHGAHTTNEEVAWNNNQISGLDSSKTYNIGIVVSMSSGRVTDVRVNGGDITSIASITARETDNFTLLTDVPPVNGVIDFEYKSGDGSYAYVNAAYVEEITPEPGIAPTQPPQGGEVFQFSGSNYAAQPTGPMTFTQGTRTISRAVTISNWDAEEGSFTGVTDTALPGVPAAGASDTPALLYGEPVTISLPDPGA